MEEHQVRRSELLRPELLDVTVGRNTGERPTETITVLLSVHQLRFSSPGRPTRKQ